MLFLSCSKQNIAIKITQYNDLTHITALAKNNDYIYCATKGGLVKWNLTTKEYTILTTADGLLSNILTDVAVDSENILWVGSREGLGSFDGTSWKNYGIPQGLPSPEITVLTVDMTGKLWIGTADGVAYFEQGRFKLLKEEGSPGRNYINDIYFDRGENLWIATKESGIYSKIDTEWKKHSPNTQKITQSWDLRMWCVRPTEVNFSDGKAWLFYSLFDKANTHGARDISSTNERLWFFTSSGVHASHGSTDWIHFTEEEGLLSNDVTTGLVESNEKIYVGTVDGLSVIDNGTIENYVVTNNPVGYNYISVSIDDTDRAWLGTWETGLSIYDSGYWSSLSGSTPEDLATVRSTVFGPDGTIVFNTPDGITFYQDRTWKKYTRLSGVSGNDVRCGVFDTKGRYWAGTSTGICYFDNNRWKRFRTLHGLPSEDTWACGVDAKGTVWFGTTDGIVSFTEDELYDHTPEIGLEEIDVRSILAVGDSVYFGTTSGKLILYDGETWDVYSNRYLHTEKEIYTITSEPSGALWFGTNGDGIIRLENGKTMTLTMADGLPFDVVRSITYHNGVLWAACYGGVATVELKEIEE